uniref:TRM5/TYW2-like methyltransferase domain-containing protein n=1 Tax=Odontella aurita TaxID=265563 RepID=A0A7S4NHC8_9STRA|mmetsp:Transcript_7531/g.22070  ORF Transcript_7531/g.22070 Transcript_7531/m.22070 type:complete len:344 (+) Transcript_7531:168-1199(+)
MSAAFDGTDEATDVLFIRRRDTKTAKLALERANLLDKEYRISPAASFDGRIADDRLEGKPPLWPKDCVAVPVTLECINLTRTSPSEGSVQSDWKDLVVGHGRQVCPFSSASLGRQRQGGRRRHPRKGSATCSDGLNINSLSTVQLAIFEALVQCIPDEKENPMEVSKRKEIVRDVQALPLAVCPNKIERMGDDHTLVIPRKALTFDDEAFLGLFERAVTEDVDSHVSLSDALKLLWLKLASMHGSSRVVRRGDIDPESKVRESGHRILWPEISETSAEGVPIQTGPGSPGWITVTEHGIKQSFDLTRVMFSRGNVTEKKRFGELVKEGEVVLDMYAGRFGTAL